MTKAQELKAQRIAIAHYREQNGRGPKSVTMKESATFVRVMFDDDKMQFMFISKQELE